MKSLKKVLISMAIMFLVITIFSIVSFADSFFENFNEGNNQIEQGNFIEAIEYFDRAIELDSSIPESYYNKGFALQNLYRYDEALEQYEKALEYSPNFLDAHINKTVILCESYMRDEALESAKVN